MNKVVIALLASFVAVGGVAQAANEQAAAPPSMPEMQRHMVEMHALMQQARTTQDPAERQRLMAEHMRLMNESLAMMGPMGGAASGREGERPCADTDMTCRMQRMQNQQAMMGQRMGMMQMMMQQMMEHMTQQSETETPGAGKGQ